MNTLDFLGLARWTGPSSWIGSTSLHAAILVLVVLLVRRALGTRLAPVWRHGLWLLVVARLVWPWMPESSWSLYNLVPKAGAGFGVFLADRQAAERAVVVDSRRELPTSMDAGAEAVGPAVDRRSASKDAGHVANAGRVGAGNELAPSDTLPASRVRTIARAQTDTALASKPAVDEVSASPVETSGGAVRPAHPSAPAPVTESSAESRGSRGAEWKVPGWGTLAAAIWAAGVAWLLSRWLVQQALFARKLRSAGRDVAPRVRAVLEECRRAMGVRRTVRILEVRAVSSPAVFGWLRPTVVLPEGMGTEFTEAQLRHVLLHELAHVRRRDPALNALLAVLQAVHWFNPLVWLAFHRMRMDRELATDALVLAVAGEAEARAYGRTIVQVLERWAPRLAWPGLGGVGILEDGGQLKSRIRAIAGFRRPTRWASLGSVLVFGMGALVLTNGRSATDAGAGRPAGEVVWRHAFAGWTSLGRHPELTDLRVILGLPESSALRRRLESKLAATWADALGWPSTTNAAEVERRARWLQVGLDAEHLVEVRADGDRISSWSVAARMESTAAEAWVREGRELLERAGGGGGFAGGAPRAERMGAWVAVGGGPGGFEAARESVRGLGDQPLLKGSRVATLDADLARMARLRHWGERAPGLIGDWPRFEGTWEARKGRLRTEARLSYPRDLGLKIEPWIVPTNLVHDPLVGFTAAQGLESWLGREMGDAGAERKWGHQGYYWSLANQPWQQYFAVAQDVPEELLKHLAEAGVSAAANRFGWNASIIHAVPAPRGGRVDFLGLPYLQPYCMRVKDRGRTWLHGGAFPLPGRGAPLPEGLLAQIEGRRDLVAYDWETTGRRWVVTNRSAGAGGAVSTNDLGRLRQMRDLVQFGEFLRDRKGERLPLRATGDVWVPGTEWVEAAVPWLGDAVTEVRKAGERELAIVRSSGVGFNSGELMKLFAWLDDVPPAPRVRAGAPRTKEARGATHALARAAGGEATPAATPTSASGEKPLPPGIVRLRARAVDAVTGAPVPKFRLLWAALRYDGDDPALLEWNGGADTEATDGEVEVPLHWEAPGMRFAATASGYLLSVSPEYATAGQKDYTFKMQPGSGPKGKVISKDGKPLAGVSVGVLGYGLTLLSGGKLGSSSYDGRGVTRTDADGAFSLPAVVVRPRVVAADPELGYAEVSGEPLEKDPTIRLEPWGRVEGLARRGNRVAGDVTLHLRSPLGVAGPHVILPVDDDHRIRADGQGRFAFRRVPPGKWLLTEVTGDVEKEPKVLELGEVEVRAGESTWMEVQVKSPASGAGAPSPAVNPNTQRSSTDASPPRGGRVLEGRVTSEQEGKAVEGADVQLGSVGGGRGRPWRARTDETGRFRIEVDDIGPATLTIEAENFHPARQEVVIGPGQGVVEVRLHRGRELRGRVEDDAGRPLAGVVLEVAEWPEGRLTATVLMNYGGNFGIPVTELAVGGLPWWKPVSGMTRWHAVTDAQGRFAWKDVPREGFVLKAEKVGYVAQLFGVEVAARDEVVLRMKPALVLNGKVEDRESGWKIPSGIVWFRVREEGQSFGSATPWRSMGPGVAGGEIHLTQRFEAGVEVQFLVTAPRMRSDISRAFGTTGIFEQNFPMSPVPDHAGVIVDRSGKPMAGAQIAVLGVSSLEVRPGELLNRYSSEFNPVRSDAEGHFALPAVLPEARLVAMHPDAGYAETTEETLRKTGRFELQPWGTLEGVWRLGDGFATNRRIVLRRHDWPGNGPDLAEFVAVTDEQGRFSFPKVPPGSVRLQRLVNRTGPPPMAQLNLWAPGPSGIEIRAGETNRISVGGRGVRVVGRVQTEGRGWQFPMHFALGSLRPVGSTEPSGPQATFGRGSDLSPVLGAMSPEMAPPFELTLESHALEWGAEGRFQVEDVEPGEYELRVPRMDPLAGEGRSPQPLQHLTRKIVVPAPRDVPGRVLDIGMLNLE